MAHYPTALLGLSIPSLPHIVPLIPPMSRLDHRPLPPRQSFHFWSQFLRGLQIERNSSLSTTTPKLFIDPSTVTNFLSTSHATFSAGQVSGSPSPPPPQVTHANKSPGTTLIRSHVLGRISFSPVFKCNFFQDLWPGFPP